MRSFWSDPYLWVHLAGVAALPIFLETCLLGLAAGDPFLPAVLELGFVAAVGIVPIFWMQWQRPFYIFSLVAIALQPAQLTDEQRRLLRLFKTQEVRVLTAIAPVILTIALWQLYKLAPLAAEVTPFAGQWRLVGLLVAAITFLACNLFLQVPLSVLRVLLVSDAKLAAIEPYPLEQIAQDFTVLGLRVKQILPAIARPPAPVAATEPAVAEVGSPAAEAIVSDNASAIAGVAATPTVEATATTETAETAETATETVEVIAAETAETAETSEVVVVEVAEPEVVSPGDASTFNPTDNPTEEASLLEDSVLEDSVSADQPTSAAPVAETATVDAASEDAASDAEAAIAAETSAEPVIQEAAGSPDSFQETQPGPQTESTPEQPSP